MTSFVKANRTGLLLTAGALLLFSVAPARAGFAQNMDTSQLMARINQLETQVQTLSRSVYKGGGAPVSAPAFDDNGSNGGSADASGIASYDARISAIEDQQRKLTGQVEQMNYDIQQMKDKLGKALSDNDMRFQQLENGKGAGATGASSGSSYNNSSTGDDMSTGSYSPDSSSVTASTPGRGKVLGTLSSAGGKTASPQAMYDDAFNDIRDAKYDSAATKFQAFMTQYPKDPLAANAQYWLAETFYVRQDYKQSAKLFAQDYQQFPQGAKAPAALLKLGLSLGKLGKKDDACLSYAQLKKEFPGDQTPEIKRATSEMKQLGCPQ
ncbi:MAG: tol-pal system protein YbgF [Micavibrio sp.]|nr:tol-pal system protein YbgF [Micavibrio sp.]